MPKWEPQHPHWMDHGIVGQFHWLQSCCDNIPDEILQLFPEIYQGKWIAMTGFDSAFLPPYGTSKGTDKANWIGEPKLIESLSELPRSGNEDEFYVFDDTPDVVKINSLRNLLFATHGRISELQGANHSETDEEAARFWQQLTDSGASAYFVFDNFGFIAIKAPTIVERFLQSPFALELPLRHINETAERLRGCLNIETTEEPCAQQGCHQNRVTYGVNCPQHHFEMLHKMPFPFHLMDIKTGQQEGTKEANLEINFRMARFADTDSDSSDQTVWGQLEFLVNGENYFATDYPLIPEPLTEHCAYLEKFKSEIATAPALEIPNYEHDSGIWLKRKDSSLEWTIHSANGPSKATIHQDSLVKAIDDFRDKLDSWLDENGAKHPY